MTILFFLLGLVAFLAGGGVLAAARSEAHQIEAVIMLLIGAVLWTGAGIVTAVDRLREELARARKPDTPE